MKQAVNGRQVINAGIGSQFLHVPVASPFIYKLAESDSFNSIRDCIFFFITIIQYSVGTGGHAVTAVDAAALAEQQLGHRADALGVVTP